MLKTRGQHEGTQTAATSSSSVSPLDSIYVKSLLWLTPSNPFGDTNLTFAFGSARGGTDPQGRYALYSPESTVDSLAATNWNTGIGPQATSVRLPNGDVIETGGLRGEQAAVLIALEAWTAFTDITLERTTSFQNADLKFLVTNETGMRNYWSGEAGVLGFATLPNDYGPNYGITGQQYSPGYSVFNQNGYGWTNAGLQPGGYGYLTILHEVGHLFGLDHPWNEGGFYVNADGSRGGPEPYFPGATSTYKTGDYGLNQGVFTSMSYNDGWSGQPSRSADWGYQIGPGAFDIAAMQRLYGTNTSYHAESDTYVLPAANGSGTGWFCIYDAGGNADTIAAPERAGSATIDLRPATLMAGDPGAGGYVSWVKGVAGGFTIANGVTVENATGGNSNDKITGNDANNVLKGLGGDDHLDGGAGRDDLQGGSGKDILLGGLGDDLLWGGADADVLTGGPGSDVFIFRSALEVGLRSARDTITDFASGSDHLDFSSFFVGDVEIDFYFVGDGALVAGDHRAGELNLSRGVLSGDYNNDGRADFQIAMSGVTSLSHSDFFGLLMA
jgi:serralysin